MNTKLILIAIWFPLALYELNLAQHSRGGEAARYVFLVVASLVALAAWLLSARARAGQRLALLVEALLLLGLGLFASSYPALLVPGLVVAAGGAAWTVATALFLVVSSRMLDRSQRISRFPLCLGKLLLVGGLALPVASLPAALLVAVWFGLLLLPARSTVIDQSGPTVPGRPDTDPAHQLASV